MRRRRPSSGGLFSAGRPVLIILMTLAMILGPLAAGLAGAVPSYADETPSDADTAAETTGDAQPADNADKSDAAGTATLTLETASATVAADAGYQAKLTVTNGTDATLAAGTVSAFINDQYVFASSLLMQDWAEGKAQIDTPRSLGQAQVSELAPGASQTVEVSADADSLRDAFNSWGPKPVLFSYTAGAASGGAGADGADAGNADAAASGRQEASATLHTFVTRDRDSDISPAQTPAINMVVAMPLTVSGWQMDEDSTQSLFDKGTLPEGVSDVTRTVTPTENAMRQGKRLAALASAHPHIQAVADSTFVSLVGGAQTAAALQPDGFDISTYGQLSNLPWTAAGMDMNAWKADRAQAQTQSKDGGTAANGTDADNNAATKPTIAWQGAADWTMSGLSVAHNQGYGTVVAESGFDPAYPDAVSTSKTTVSTASGDVTVLVAQKELSTLAQGHATSSQATCEATAAGQINRFIAQAALYQMERPYESRTLLVSLKDASAPDAVDTIMTTLEQSSWVSLSSLQDLLAADTDETNAYALESEDTTTIDDQTAETIGAQVRTLAANGTQLKSFASSVLDVAPSDSAAASGTTNDPGALARQDASDTKAKTSATAIGWTDMLSAIHTHLARMSMSIATGADATLASADGRFVQQLYNGVSLVRTDSISTVSETGSMPITVSNRLPYAVKVVVSADTDSDSIVVSDGDGSTGNQKTVSVAAHGETQVTFPLRIISTGTATATFSLLDRDGKSFGEPTMSNVHSVLRISDMSGTAILVLAGILGVLGLWRQFHRKKDPDQ